MKASKRFQLLRTLIMMCLKSLPTKWEWNVTKQLQNVINFPHWLTNLDVISKHLLNHLLQCLFLIHRKVLKSLSLCLTLNRERVLILSYQIQTQRLKPVEKALQTLLLMKKFYFWIRKIRSWELSVPSCLIKRSCFFARKRERLSRLCWQRWAPKEMMEQVTLWVTLGSIH